MPSKTRSQLIFPADGESTPTNTRWKGGGSTNTGEGEGGRGSSRTSCDANATSDAKVSFPPAKRPSSPFKGLDGKVLQEREVKRAKRVIDHQRLGESSNPAGSTHGGTEQVWASRPPSPRKPSSTSSMPSPKSDFMTATLTPRAHSVPPVPEIDLTRVPPSPWRSPSKKKEKFRFTSVPPNETLPEVSEVAQRDQDGDVQMGEATSIDVAPPPSSRPSSPMTPLDSFEDPTLSLTSLPAPTPALVKAHSAYEDIQVEVKTYDGEAEAGPSTQPDMTTPKLRTPSTATRIPRATTKSMVQLTLSQAFASTQARIPSRGVKSRMKPKNATGSNPPSNTSTPDLHVNLPERTAPTKVKPRPLPSTTKNSSTTPRAKAPTPALKESLPRAKTPVAPVLRSKTPTRTVETVRSRTPAPVASTSQPKTPVRTSSIMRSKTPVPYVEVPMPRTPRGVANASTVKTPGSSRPRSQSTGPAGPKTPGRVGTPARSKSVERAPIATRTSSRPSSPVPGTRSDSPLTDLTNSRSGSPQPETRGRTRTPRALSPIPVVDSTRIESPAARTDGVLQTAGDFISESFVAIGGDEDEDAAEPPLDRMDITPKASQPSSGVVYALASDASTSPVPLGSDERPTMPLRKGKRKASVPPSRREASAPPPSSRVTRSSLLKQKENETRPDKGKHPAKPEPPKAVSRSNATNTDGRAHVARRRAQSVASFAQPTASSSARALPSPPQAKRPSATRSMSRPPASMGSRPSTSMGTYSTSTTSSLSTLSLALEKLKAPTPSRPNTSLGFNRDGPRDSLNSDSDREEAKSDSAMDVDSEQQPASPAAAAKMRHAASSGASGFTTPLYRRASTVGPSTVATASSASKSGGGSGFSQGKSTALMLPPPVPKNRPATGASAASANPPPATNKPINVRSGMVSGNPKGIFTFGNRTAGQKIFGFSGAAGLGRGGRVVHRASKETSLPVVEGSPVKGGSSNVAMDDEDESAGASAAPSEVQRTPSQLNGNANPFLTDGSDAPGASSSVVTEENHSTPKAADEQQKSPDARKNESRRASMALHFLSQSLSEYPSTPQKQGPATEGKGKGRAVSSTYPSNVADTAPSALGKAGGVGAHVSRSKSTRTTRHTPAAIAAANAAAEASPASVPSMSNTPQSVEGAPKSVKVLKGCTVFVDVKTDEGIDAGSLFIDMLQGMGAKIQSRVGQHCTHVIYKNGLVSTTNRYKALNDPKPLVVGIAWVVECAEKKTRVDETKYLVSLDHENVAGTKKRRISMIPKLLESPERPTPTPTGSNRPTNVHSSPPSEDTSANGSFDHLPPLERARRRQSALFSA